MASTPYRWEIKNDLQNSATLLPRPNRPWNKAQILSWASFHIREDECHPGARATSHQSVATALQCIAGPEQTPQRWERTTRAFRATTAREEASSLKE
jgi:hypothetical protein